MGHSATCRFSMQWSWGDPDMIRETEVAPLTGGKNTECSSFSGCGNARLLWTVLLLPFPTDVALWDWCRDVTGVTFPGIHLVSPVATLNLLLSSLCSDYYSFHSPAASILSRCLTFHLKKI